MMHEPSNRRFILALPAAAAALATLMCTRDPVLEAPQVDPGPRADSLVYQKKIEPGTLGFEPFYDTASIRFSMPVWFGEYIMPGSFMVAEVTGRMQLLIPDSAGVLRLYGFGSVHPVGGDGLLGVALHPRFFQNHKYYVYYNVKEGQCALEERMASASFWGDSGVSRRLLVSDVASGHYGGDMHFGPDGFLYLGIGDQSAPGAQNTNPQDLAVLFGKMLRIDVDARDAGEYGIPADNPFVGRAGARPEVYAYGLRNPWRFSFDALDGRLVEGEVGNIVQEEVNIIARGGNYGWRIREGNTCFNAADEGNPLPTCDTTGLIPPIAVLPHDPNSSGAALIGGYVFRGDPDSPYYGSYIFGDYVSRKVYALHREGDADSAASMELLGQAPAAMSTFGTDWHGNLYMVGYKNGIIYRLDHQDLRGLR